MSDEGAGERPIPTDRKAGASLWRLRVATFEKRLPRSWRGRADAIVAVGLTTVSHYGFDLLVARSNGIDVFGVYSVTFSYAFVLATVASMGFPELANRRVAELRNENDSSSVVTFAMLGISMLTVVGLASGLLAISASSIGVIALPPQAAVGLVLLVPLLAIFNFLRQLALIARRSALGLLMPVAVLGLASIILFTFSRFSGPSIRIPLMALMFAYLTGGSILAIHSLPRVARGMSFSIKRAWASWRSSAGPVVFSNIATVLTAHLDLLVVAQIATPAGLGFYAAASRLSQAMTLPLSGIALRDAPRFGRLLAQSRFRECWETFRASMNASTLFAGLIGAFLIAFGHSLLGLFGGGSDDAWIWLVILVVGRAASAATGPVALLLITMNRGGLAAAGAAVGLGVSILAMVILGSALGLVGVAVGKALGLVAQNGVQFLLARQAMLDAEG